MKVFMNVFDILKTHTKLCLLKNVEIHQHLCTVVPYLEIEVYFCLFPMCSGPDNCHFRLHLKFTFLHAGMCVNDRKSSGFLVSVFEHSTLMCHEGTFVWQNPIQTINALLWFLEICRGKVRKLLNHQSLNQFSGRVSWLCACTHVFLCLNQSCIFPQNHWITLLQVQTNSTSVNDCQILPLLLSGFTASTVIFFLCFSVRHICVCVSVFGSLVVMPWRVEVPTLTPPRPEIQLHTSQSFETCSFTLTHLTRKMAQTRLLRSFWPNKYFH